MTQASGASDASTPSDAGVAVDDLLDATEDAFDDLADSLEDAQRASGSGSMTLTAGGSELVIRAGVVRLWPRRDRPRRR